MSSCAALAFDPVVTMPVGGVQLVAYLALFVWHLRAQRKARQGDERAGQVIITKAYMYIIYGFGISLLLFLLGSVFFHSKPFASDVGDLAGVYWGFSGFVYHFVLEGIVVLLCFKGIGRDAFQQACLVTFVLAILVGAAQGLTYIIQSRYPSHDYGLYIQIGYESVLFVFYLFVVLAPRKWLYRRPAAIFYACCWTAYRPGYMVLFILMYKGYDGAYCGYMIFTWLMFGVAKPLIIYYTLYLDSLYWQGLYVGIFALRSRSSSSSIDDSLEGADVRKPLLGVSFDQSAAAALAEQMGVISQEDRMSANLGYFILGAGGTARVFRGIFEDKRVAIKMLFCPTLIPETIDNFRRENALLCSIRHPNIIQVEGLCVEPPAICSVMEYCPGRKARIFSHTESLVVLPSICVRQLVADSHLTGYVIAGDLFGLLRLPSTRTIDWSTRLAIACDCARAVTCLHELGLETFVEHFYAAAVRGSSSSRSHPGLLQLAADDLERIVPFRRRHLPNDLSAFDRLQSAIADIQRISALHDSQQAVIKLTDLELSDDLNALPASDAAEDKSTDVEEEDNTKQTVVPNTVNWTAPEAILYGRRTRAADVYSLGMVLWEILSGQVPFYEHPQHQVYKLVTEDETRPVVPADADADYAALMQDMWHQ
ncbi:uncharacterized protein MONBRDRAFT_6777, partial [Monosiga brevicollis MX1]